MRNLFFIILFLPLLFFSCGGPSGTKSLPRASGKPGDLILVMDSMERKTELGKELQLLLEGEIEGLPHNEPMFNVIWVHPKKTIGLLNQVRNIVYVFTLDQSSPGTQTLIRSFSPESIQKIRQDTTYFFHTREDEFSRGQQVLYLFGNTRESLTRYLKKNGKGIVALFNNAERKRLESTLFKSRDTKKYNKMFQEKYQFILSIPIGYKLAQSEKDFVWLRQIEANADKDVFLSRKPYTSQAQLLPDSVIAWRDNIARKYLFEDPEKTDSYLIIEKEVPFHPVKAKQIDFKGDFAMEIRGLWRSNNFSMGGPFVGIAVVDKSRKYLYYLEGFAYSPGREQRETMRELETVLHTFQSSEGIPVKK